MADAVQTTTTEAPADTGETSLIGTAADGGTNEVADNGSLLADVAKPEGTNTGADDVDTEVEGAPEEYADFAAPDGMSLDADTLGDFKGIAKELNLSQANAQRLVDTAVKLQTSWGEAAQAQLQTVYSDWSKASLTEFSTDGKSLSSEVSAATSRALDTYGTPALRELLAGALGSHPEIIRLLDKVGKTVSEDGFVAGGKPVAQKRTAASVLYPNQTPKE